MTHYYTSITNNYLPKARILARSIREHDPASVFHLVLCDAPPPGFDRAKEPFDHVHGIDDLGIPDVKRWLFKHDLVEMCTAVKGPALCKILNEYDADQVMYFDPDIAVLSDLAELQAHLAKTSVLLTPHQATPEDTDDAIIDNEVCSLKHGVYNLGYLGVRRTPEGMAFANWWRARLLSYCIADIPGGLFTDQRWVDLATCFFADVKVLRDPQYNVATWNLSHRVVTRDPDGRLIVDGKPVVFFHFSGFDSGGQLLMLRKYAPLGSPLFGLRDWYIAEMEKQGQKTLGKAKCAYSTYADGAPIPLRHRRIYRRRTELAERFLDPFAIGGGGSLRQVLEEEFPGEDVATPAADLQRTITWRVGRMLTAPIERAMSVMPGWVPRVKRLLRK